MTDLFLRDGNLPSVLFTNIDEYLSVKDDLLIKLGIDPRSF